MYRKMLSLLFAFCLFFNPAISVKAGSLKGPVLVYSFDEALIGNQAVDSAGGNNATLYGNATYITDPQKGQVLRLDGSYGTYLEFPRGFFDNLNTFTISMDVLSYMTENYYFTFTVGVDNIKYFFLNVAPTGLKGAITINSNPAEQKAENHQMGPQNGQWMKIICVVEPNRIAIYKNGEKIVENKNVTVKISDLGQNLISYLGKSFYSGDKYFNGCFDNVKIYDRVLTEEEILGVYDMTDEEIAEADYNNLFLSYNLGALTHDLDLKTKGKYTSDISWEISDTSVITEDGKVRRGKENKKVTVTATITKGDYQKVKTFDITVLAEEEMAAYLFVYFTGNAAEQERIYYGVSKDGYNFKALNGGEPVLISTVGTGCVRDPFILKGQDGYYYILATDMRSSLGWASNHAIVIFKTADLIHIEETIHIDYKNFESTKNCNRAWAPQAIWCPEKEAYMVYLAIQNEGDPRGTVMWRHYTKDFKTYTEPEFMLAPPDGIGGAIDGDIIYDPVNDRYIMYYDGKRIAVSDKISGEFSAIDPNTGREYERIPFKTSSGVDMDVEGSNIYNIIGTNKYIIAADGTPFNGGKYALVETTDFINYRQLNDNEYSFNFTPRHGYVIQISQRELDNLLAQYGDVFSTHYSTADFSYMNIGPYYGKVTFSFDAQTKELTDGIFAFTASTTNPDNYNSYNIVVRFQPNGTMDARNGASFSYTNPVYYEVNKFYHIDIEVNINTKQYSVYVTPPSGGKILLADKFAFRSDAPVANDIGKFTIRAGHGYRAGIFFAKNFEVKKEISARVENAKYEDGKLTFDVLADEDEEVIIYAAGISGKKLEYLKASGAKVYKGAPSSFSFDMGEYEKVKIFIWYKNTLFPAALPYEI